MSYNARVRARQNRAGGLYGFDRGWEVGSNQGGAIGIPARLVRKINERTTPINYDGNGVKRDDRNLVVQQNTLSGVGRYRSQFNVDSDGIKSVRYYIGDEKDENVIQAKYSWEEAAGSFNGNWHGIISSLNGEKLAICGVDKYVYISDDRGGTWDNQSSMIPPPTRGQAVARYYLVTRLQPYICVC